tara:strand:+ start:37 stop:231 length:195 start_codon:yes stop_codon:yes gene_type:complete
MLGKVGEDLMKAGDLVWVNGEGVGVILKLYHIYGVGIRQLVAVLFPHGEYDVFVDECEVISEAA